MYNTCILYYTKNILTIFIIVTCFGYVLQSQHTLVKYDYPINTESYDEICPILSFNQDKIFITRIGSPDFNRTLVIDSVDVSEILEEKEYTSAIKKVYKQIASHDIQDVISSSFNQEIWTIVLDENQKPKDMIHPGYPINNALPNSVCSRFDDHGRYIVINQFEETGGLDKGFSITQMVKGQFSFPKPLDLDGFYLKSGKVNLTSSSDQKVLILSLPGEGGDMDLYISHQIYHTNYSRPVRIQTGINTEFNEITPVLSKDNKTLYFASDRPESLGGTDIFIASRVDDSYMVWNNIRSFNPPVNTTADEMYPYLYDDESKILFCSNRDGSQDIFEASIIRDQNIMVDLEVTIINGQTQKLMPGELYWGTAYEPGQEKENYFRCRDGKYVLKISENKPIIIQAINRKLFSQQVIIDPQELWSNMEKNKKIELILMPDAQEITTIGETKTETLPFQEILSKKDDLETPLTSSVFKNILFEKSTANILQQSLPTINTLGKFLRMNKQIIIEIQGHTDNVGNTEDLQKLSLDRAITIKKILTAQDIDGNRIITSGFGDTVPVTDNSTEVLRRKNRRVEIRIVHQNEKPDL